MGGMSTALRGHASAYIGWVKTLLKGIGARMFTQSRGQATQVAKSSHKEEGARMSTQCREYATLT